MADITSEERASVAGRFFVGAGDIANWADRMHIAGFFRGIEPPDTDEISEKKTIAVRSRIKMEQKIVRFFEERNRPVKQIMARGRKHGLEESQIEQGMKIVYDRVLNGEDIRPIQIVWEVWAAAKRCKSEEYIIDQDRISALLKVNRNLRASLMDCNKRWITRIFFVVAAGIIAAGTAWTIHLTGWRPF